MQLSRKAWPPKFVPPATVFVGTSLCFDSISFTPHEQSIRVTIHPRVPPPMGEKVDPCGGVLLPCAPEMSPSCLRGHPLPAQDRRLAEKWIWQPETAVLETCELMFQVGLEKNQAWLLLSFITHGFNGATTV